MHFQIASLLTGIDFKLSANTVHHLDEINTNNNPNNLIVIRNSDHTKLHTFLERYKKSYTGNNWEVERILKTKQFLKVFDLEVIWLEEKFLRASVAVKSMIKSMIVTNLMQQKTKE